MIVAHFRELYRYRALILALVGRDVKARYRGAVLGFLWTILNPLTLMAVYTLIFSTYMRVAIPSYAIFLLSALLPWTWFSTSVSQGSVAILSGGALLKKVFFPPQVLPATVVLSNLVNYLLSLLLLPIFYVVLEHRISPIGLIALPLVLAIQFVLTLGFVVLVAAATVVFRDLQHLVTNLLMLAFFLTPIAYSTDIVPEKYRPLVELNPFAPLMEAYQAIFHEGRIPALAPLGVLLVGGLLFLLLAVLIFERLRDHFVEVV